VSAYYNEIDTYAAEWLRNLIKSGHIADGTVDTRSIEDVRPDDLVGYDQCHFFAGIGGWSRALRLAEWPDDRPVWTGSCPCQPFSAAGKGGGFADERHLWPAWFHLISECRPGIIFGEQVASPDGLRWLELVHADLEAQGYAVGTFDLCAAGVGAPELRQRLWIVAQSSSERCNGQRLRLQPGESQQDRLEARWRGEAGRLANGNHKRLEVDSQQPARKELEAAKRGGAVGGFWSDAEWLEFTDGKARPVEPGTFPLADGIPNRVGRLRAYGNAIVPEVAAEVIGSFMEVAP
jgi:DNA (cytosine-5)-methyltransferase 1